MQCKRPIARNTYCTSLNKRNLLTTIRAGQSNRRAPGEITMTQARTAASAGNAAAIEVFGAAKEAAHAAGQAVAGAHVAAHELGAAAHVIRAIRAAPPEKSETL